MENVNEAWSFMKNIISDNLKKMCLVRKFRVFEKRDAWLNNELLERILDKNRLLSIARKSGNEEDCNIARVSRNVINKELSNVNKNFLLDEQENYKKKKDPKMFGNQSLEFFQIKETKMVVFH